MRDRLPLFSAAALLLAAALWVRLQMPPEPNTPQPPTGFPAPAPAPALADLHPVTESTGTTPSVQAQAESGFNAASPSPTSRFPSLGVQATPTASLTANSAPTPHGRASDPGLSATDWRGIEEQIREAQHHFTPHEPQWDRGEGWTAANPGSGFGVHIDGAGVSARAWAPRGEPVPWTWSLTALDPRGTTEARDSSVSVRRAGGVEEWFHNTPGGLEHGMTIPHRDAPVGARLPSGERSIPFLLRSSLQPEVADAGRSIHFRNPQGEVSLRYEDLWVTDALGNPLPARLVLSSHEASVPSPDPALNPPGHTLTWVFDDAHAVYPVTVDPKLTRLEQRLFDPALSESAGAGTAVSISANAVAIGAPLFTAQGVRTGAVLVFRRDALGLWSREAQIAPPSPVAGLGFGAALALEADLLAIAAPATQPGAGSGFVTIHARNQGGANQWGRVKTITPSGPNPDSGDFGTAVSLSGTTLAVGAPGLSERGRVFVFERNQGGTDQWGQTRELRQETGDFDPTLPDRFGVSVSVREDVLAIGAPGEGSAAAIGGAVYIHERNLGGSGQWGLRKREFGGVFEDVRRGRWVSASATHVAFSLERVSIPNTTRTRIEFAVLARDNSATDGWRLEEQFTVPEPNAAAAEVGTLRGFAMSGSLLALTLDIGQGSTFHLFERSGTPPRWQEIAVRVGEGGTSVQGTQIAVGTRVFDRPRTAWTLMSVPPGSPPLDGPGAHLGRTVALDGEVLVVGAPRASIPAANGAPAAAAGVAWVFHRNQGAQNRDHAWSLVKSLSLPGARAGDEFGAAVALREDWIAIGAPRRAVETRISTGGGNVITNRVPEAGAVYFFRRHLGGQDQWGFDGELLNPQPVGTTSARSRFGFSVALTEQFLAVGAPGAFSQELSDERGAVFLFQSTSSPTQPDWSFLKRVPHSAGRREEFGFSLALDNDVLVVGSPASERTDTADTTDPGVALVFQRDVGGPNNWGLDQGLSPSGPILPGERFGHAVALSTHRIAIGAPGTDQVFLFAEGAAGDGRGGWRVLDILRPPTGSPPSRFGQHVALSGPAAVVGAPTFSGTGAAFVFAHRPDTSLRWALEATVLAATPRAGAEFGAAVALNGQDLAVGEPLAARVGSGSGAVSVFHRQFRDLTLQTSRASEDIALGDRFGFSVALDGDQLLVGAPFDNGPGADSGAAYLFQRIRLDGTQPNWRQFRKLTANDAATGDNFGVHVALHNTVAVVGAFRKEFPGNSVGEDGAAYIFERNAGGADAWGQSRRLTGGIHYGISVAVHDHRVAVCSEFFNFVDLYERNAGPTTWGRIQHLELEANASKVALHGDLLVCGAETEAINRQPGTGAVYVFDRHFGGSNRWGRVSKLLGSSPGGGFGSSVDVQNDLIAVGARFETGGPADREPEHGRVHVFERIGDTSFRVVDRLSAPDSSSGARFGTMVALSDDLLLVGAINAHRSPTLLRTGAAYLFERNRFAPGRWQVTQKLTGEGTQSGDEFGGAVDLSGRTAVVGARSFGSAATGNADQGRLFVFELAGSGFDSFLARHFPGVAAPGDVPELADLADFDGDGVSNVAEAGYGTDPALADSAKAQILATLEDPSGVPVLFYPESAEPLGVQLRLQWSPDLIDWYASQEGPEGGQAPEIQIETLGLQENARFLRRARLVFPMDAGTGRALFLRLQIHKQ